MRPPQTVADGGYKVQAIKILPGRRVYFPRTGSKGVVAGELALQQEPLEGLEYRAHKRVRQKHAVVQALRALFSASVLRFRSWFVKPKPMAEKQRSEKLEGKSHKARITDQP